MPDGRQRVLVLGGGFAGVGAVHELAKSDVDVVLIDEHDHHTFTGPARHSCTSPTAASASTRDQR